MDSRQTRGSDDKPDPVCTPREALEQPREDLVVGYSRELTLGGEDGSRECAQFLRTVRVASFEDLQRLGFVPERLDEKRAREAIARDDETALATARDVVRQAPARGKSCCCDSGDEERDGANADAPALPPRADYASALRATYQDVRRRHHPQLAQALTESLRAQVAWDSPVVSHAHKWIAQLGSVKELLVPGAFLNNITVLNNATFNVAAGTQLLLANEIRIHVGGKIRSQGSYLKIKCISIQGNLP